MPQPNDPSQMPVGGWIASHVSLLPAATAFGLVALLLTCGGCWTSAGEEVVVYAALDREFSEPILRDFEKETGIRVLAKYDVESTKTVGLVNAIIEEQRRPRCDVFWNNEILHTLRLQELGLLEPCPIPAAKDWPAEYRGTNAEWYGLAARARVLIVNTELVKPEERPDSIRDMVDPRWRKKVGIAKPLFGTTATHAAVLFASWGEDEAGTFFSQLMENAEVLAGNKQVATAVGRGQLAFGWTDTDDAIIEQDQGRPVELVYPDQEDGGTLRIPNSLGLIRGSRNQAAGRKLIAYLLRPEVERRLAAGRSAQFPVNPAVQARSRAAPETPIRWQAVDFQAAAQAWKTAVEFLSGKLPATESP